MPGHGSSPIATHHNGAISAIAAFFQLAISRVRASWIPADSSSSAMIAGNAQERMFHPMRGPLDDR
ncbi:hypothetical protein LTR94_038692, partial [Friedmanniomyces endolithicus]